MSINIQRAKMADGRKLPIDIQYRKLLEALVDRKIVPVGWVTAHEQVRAGLAVLFPELPTSTEALAKSRARFLSHEELTYFDCRHVFACLQEAPEGHAKNFFGQYTSPVLKKWQALLRLYEKNNLFAAEAARVLTQNTAFEIPFLKKTIAQNEKQVTDNKRKILDLTKSIAEYKRKLETACADIGIPGVHFREELERLPTELPTLFAAVAEAICSEEIHAAIEYHEALQTYLHNCEIPSAAPAAPASSTKGKGGKHKQRQQQEPAPVVPGDDEVIVPMAFFPAISELRNASDEYIAPTAVDFATTDEVAEIDWDISLADDSNADAATIDWGIETLADAGSAEGGNMDTPVEIDWDITTTDIVAESMIDDTTLHSSAITGAVVSTDDSASRVGLMTNNDFRTRVLNDLLELKMFLRQRRSELADNTNVAFANQFQGASPLLEHQSDERVKAFQEAVERALAQLTDKRLQQLVLIKTSDRYLDRQVANLEMLTKHMDKCAREIKAIEDKNVDLVDATTRIQPQIDGLVARTKKLKKELQEALPPLFKGYTVNIVGDINNL